MPFFYDSAVKRVGVDGRTEDALKLLHSRQCSACPLYTSPAKTKSMPPSGADTPLVYVLGEAPGKNEDECGKQFVGRAGDTLRAHIPKWANAYIRFNNVVRTRPPQNRTPEWMEIECCRPSVAADIARTRPQAIFAFGGVPLKWATGQTGVKKWRGRRLAACIDGHICWVYPMYHPAYINRVAGNDDDLGLVFKHDLVRAFQDIKDRTPPPQYIPAIDFDQFPIYYGADHDDLTHVLHHIQQARASGLVTFDHETKHLRPYHADSKLLSTSLAYDDVTMAFAIDHRKALWDGNAKKQILGALTGLFTDQHCAKIAHNLAFDLEWSIVKIAPQLKAHTQPWHDTMVQAYCLDERHDGLSLNDRCIATFGLDLKALSGHLDVANLDEEPVEDVLRYNCGDSYTTHKLHRYQQDQLLRVNQFDVYEMHMTRIPTTVKTQIRGLLVDQDVVITATDTLEQELQGIVADIQEIKEVKQYRRDYGEFNPGSTHHVAKLLTRYLATNLPRTATGTVRTNEDALAEIDHPIAKAILLYRQRTKLKSTYIDPLNLNTDTTCVYPDGMIHTSLNTMFTRTGRTSSNDPNVQNFPARKDKWIRRAIIARPGHTLVSNDYGQIEARVIAMASLDKNFIDALWNKYDVHMEWAERIARAHSAVIGGRRFLTDKDAMKAFRQTTKSDFVFASFFGATADTTAHRLGIPLYKATKLLDEFWEIFSGVREWQERMKKAYAKQGFVETLTGRRRHAPLSANKIINTPIQGTASDIVVNAMDRLSIMAEEQDRPQLQAVLNIHDDLEFELPNETLDSDMDDIIGTMLTVPYTFAQVVPISVETKLGPNWCDFEPVGDFFSNEW